MCPVCLANAVLIAGSATSTGGFAALAIRKFSGKNAVDEHSASPSSNCFEKRTD
jgi:hypothetical protein